MKLDQGQNLERIIESAVVASWADLVRDPQSGLIHVEYGFAASGTLECLQIWSSITRGHWLLVCDYRMSAFKFHDAGVHFHNGYQSEGLTRILEAVMQHQSAFALPPNLGRQRLLQISTPTAEESAVAVVLINAAFDRVTSTFAEPAVA